MTINKGNVGFRLQVHAWSGTEICFVFVQNPLCSFILLLTHLGFAFPKIEDNKFESFGFLDKEFFIMLCHFGTLFPSTHQFTWLGVPPTLDVSCQSPLLYGLISLISKCGSLPGLTPRIALLLIFLIWPHPIPLLFDGSQKCIPGPNFPTPTLGSFFQLPVKCIHFES